MPKIEFGDGSFLDETALPANQLGPQVELSNGSIADTSNTPGYGARILGGTVLGVRRNPVFGPALNHLAYTFGAEPETMDRLEDKLAGSKLADAFKIVGEFAPDFLAAGGAISWGGRLALGGLARTAPQAGLNLTRGVQIAGRSAGLGGYEAGRTAAEGRPAREVLIHGAIGAGFGVGVEVAVTGVARLLSRRARARSDDVLRKLQARPEFAQGQKVLLDAEESLSSQLGKARNEVEKVLGSREQELELLKSLNPRERTLFMGSMLGEELATKTVTPGQLLPVMKALGVSSKQAAKQLKASSGISARNVLLQKQSDLNAVQQLKGEHASVVYTRDVPFNPDGAREVLSTASQGMLRAPESYQGELGIAGSKFMDLWRTADDLTTIGRDANEALILRSMNDMRKVLGISRRQAREGSKFLPLFNAWEKTGEEGVGVYLASMGRSSQTPKAIASFKEVDEAMNKSYQMLSQLGAEPALTQTDLAALGLKRFIPQVTADIPEGELFKRLEKTLGTERATDIMDSVVKEGLARFGSIDFQRSMPGSLADKITKHIPFDPHPYNGMLRYMNAVSRRLNYGERFGFKGEMGKTIVDSVVAEGGNRALIQNFTDIALGHTYYKQGMREMSRVITGLETASKMTLAFIPNMSQSINTVADVGFTKFSRGLWTALRGENRNEILKAVALTESVTRGIGRTFGEARVSSSIVSEGAVNRMVARTGNVADRLSYYTLNWTPFNWAERWNRVISGSASLTAFRDYRIKAVAGRLRGANMENARRSIKELGFDLDDIVTKTRRGGDSYLKSTEYGEIERLITFRGAQRSQFIPSQLRRPLYWNHPAVRPLTQFKTFALGQGRFIRDRILTEAAHGNLRPLAYYLSIYPVAGEVVADVRDLVRGRARDASGISRVLENHTAVGGFGIVWDTVVQARWGRSEAIFGPAVGDVLAWAENIAQGNGSGILRDVLRYPVATAIRRLVEAPILTMAIADEILDQLSENETTGVTTIDLGDLRFQQSQNKR